MTNNERNLAAAREELATTNQALSALEQDVATNHGGTMNSAHTAEWATLTEQRGLLKGRIEGLQAQIQRDRDNEQPGIVHRVGSVQDQWQTDPRCGYESPSAFLTDVMRAGTNPNAASPQLRFLAAAGADEQSTTNDPYGGFLVPSGFMPNIKATMADDDPTASRCTPLPMDAPSLSFPARVDKDHSTSFSGGLRVYRRAETQDVDASRMQMERIKFDATSLMGVTFVSEELLERSPSSFAAILDAGFRDEFQGVTLDEKLNGNGVGRPMGVLNSPCLISVDKESGQDPDTINVTNITKMRERCWHYKSSIWLANHDTYRQLIAAHTTFSNTDQPIFTHGNGTDVPDTLLGQPIYFTEHCKALGDAGDIILGEWSQYLWATLHGRRKAESMHVRFVNHERCFKFWMENDGAPWWTSALTPRNSTVTMSPFVTLAERA